jgi:GNAT superfamily N-acetyltransferase
MCRTRQFRKEFFLFWARADDRAGRQDGGMPDATTPDQEDSRSPSDRWELALRPIAVEYDEAAELIAELDADLAVRYGSDDDPVLAHPEEFVAPHGRFFVVNEQDRPLACAGIRRIAPGTAELKRMYVRPTARGRGLARLLLATCERAAADLGFDELWLETGDAQPEAVALYLSAGYEPVPAFGQYQHSPRSITLGKGVQTAQSTRCYSGLGGVV